MLLKINTHKFFTENVLNLLNKKDVYTVLDFLKLDNKIIEKYTALTYPEIIEVKNYLAKTFSATPINGFSYYQKVLLHSALISTGISEIDDLLQGGLFTGTIYEFCGAGGSAKLLLVLTILRNVLCSGNQVFFLDTKRDFSARLMKTNLSKLKGPEESLNLLSKVLIKHVSDKYELISALFDIKKELEGGTEARIIFIHSISVVFLNSKDSTENNNILNHLANILRYLAIEHNVVIIITNLLTTWIKGDFQTIHENSERVVCGKYWRGIPNVRLKIDKRSQQEFEISLLKFNNPNSKEKCNISAHAFD